MNRGDTGFKFEQNSSKYFVLAAVVFQTEADSIEAGNSIRDLMRNMKTRPGYEFHFTKNSNKTRELFLAELSRLRFFWSAVCVKKELIKNSTVQKNHAFISKISSYLCRNIADKISDATLIYDKKDNSDFYTILKKDLTREFGNKIKKVKSQDSRKEVLLQIADYCASLVHKVETGDATSQRLFQTYLSKKCGHLQFWP
jgi:hypothetical protein